MHAINSSFGGNVNLAVAAGAGLLVENDPNLITTVENSVFAGNVFAGNGDQSEGVQIAAPASTTRFTVRNSCIQGLNRFSGAGNVDQSADEAFVEVARGNLRLNADSLCVDAGSNLVDFDPRSPGFQPLPEVDLIGGTRIVDGDGDGNPVVDAGAYEVQAE